MTRSYVWHDSFIHVTWRIRMWDRTHSYVCYDAFVCVTRLIHMCAMIHPYVQHGSLVCVTWLIPICDMTQSYDRHIRMIYMWYVSWHDTFVWLPYSCDPSVTWMCDMISDHLNHVTHRSYEYCHHSYARHIRMIYIWHVSWCDTFVWSPYSCDLCVTWLVTWHSRHTRHRRYTRVY